MVTSVSPMHPSPAFKHIAETPIRIFDGSEHGHPSTYVDNLEVAVRHYSPVLAGKNTVNNHPVNPNLFLAQAIKSVHQGTETAIAVLAQKYADLEKKVTELAAKK